MEMDKLNIGSDDPDQAIRERCFVYATQRLGGYDLDYVACEAERIFNYIKTGAIPDRGNKQ